VAGRPLGGVGTDRAPDVASRSTSAARICVPHISRQDKSIHSGPHGRHSFSRARRGGYAVAPGPVSRLAQESAEFVSCSRMSLWRCGSNVSLRPERARRGLVRLMHRATA